MRETLTQTAELTRTSNPPLGHTALQGTLEQNSNTTIDGMSNERGRIMRELLPYDYEHARDSGLLDLFLMDPETGEDGLLHTLIGQSFTDKDGVVHATGFHHEPSAEIVSEGYLDETGEVVKFTRVDRDHLKDASSRHRKKFQMRPLDPYRARVVIEGVEKHSITQDDTGNITSKPVDNGMYPIEYDALSVLKSINHAYRDLDPINDIYGTSISGGQVIINQGESVMMDGISRMRIRFVLDPKTRKIITAIPVNGNGVMKLTPEEAEKIIWG